MTATQEQIVGTLQEMGFSIESEFVERLPGCRSKWKCRVRYGVMSVTTPFEHGQMQFCTAPRQFYGDGFTGIYPTRDNPAGKQWKNKAEVPYSFWKLPKTIFQVEWNSKFTKPTEPNLADVINCLLTDYQVGLMTFDDFCSEFGMDSDSIKARKSWKASQKMLIKIQRAGWPMEKLQELFQNY